VVLEVKEGGVVAAEEVEAVVAKVVEVALTGQEVALVGTGGESLIATVPLTGRV